MATALDTERDAAGAASSPPEWERTSKYSIARGEWTVTKVIVGGVANYLLWRGRVPIQAVFLTAEKAKEHAAAMDEERGDALVA